MAVAFPELLALDLDGTLLKPDHSISDRTVSALQALHQKGCLPVLSTGRSYEGVEKILKRLSMDIPVICYNGAMIVYGKGKVLKHWLIPDDIMRGLISMAREMNIHLQAFHGKEVFAEQEGVATEYYLKATGLVTELTNFDKWPVLEMTKIIMIGPWNRESRQWPELHEMHKKLKAQYGNKIYTAFSKPFYLEVINGECSKGKALEWLMEGHDVDKEHCAAFGDGMNDLEMLQAAGISVAMENSHRNLFSHCAYKTGSCEHDGVAQFIEEHWL